MTVAVSAGILAAAVVLAMMAPSGDRGEREGTQAPRRRRKQEKEEKTDTWHRLERSSGKFHRRFKLPENAKVEQVKAAMENGVLTVIIPKVDIKKPEVMSIDISDL